MGNVLLAEAGPLDGIITAIETMATTVQTNALSLIAGLLPVLGPIIAAIIIVALGYKFVKRFSK